MEISDLKVYGDVQLPLDASYACSRMTFEHLLALGPGSLVLTEQEPGDNIDVKTGEVLIGKAELCRRGNVVIARLVATTEKTK